MAAKSSSIKRNKDAYATVGELILITNALDYQLAEVVINVLNLGSALMLMPVIATLDPSRKVEILKGWAAHISQPEWKKGVIKFVEKVERVLKYRNIACHTQPILENGEWTLKPFAAAKLLKNIDIKSKTLKAVTIKELREAVSIAESALGTGVNLVENFQRANAELAKRAVRS
jgi:hypothetical protein